MAIPDFTSFRRVSGAYENRSIVPVRSHFVRRRSLTAMPLNRARLHRALDALLDRHYATDAAWQESKHPRGQPGNAGQFGSGGAKASKSSVSSENKLKTIRGVKRKEIPLQISKPSAAEFRSFKREVESLDIPNRGTREATAAGLIMAMGNGSMLIARSDSGKTLGAVEILSSKHLLHVMSLAVHPLVITGKIPVKGVGRSLMKQVAMLAARKGLGIGLFSYDRESDKFYSAIGMTAHPVRETITIKGRTRPDPNGEVLGIGNNFVFTPENAERFARGEKVRQAKDADEDELPEPLAGKPPK